MDFLVSSQLDKYTIGDSCFRLADNFMVTDFDASIPSPLSDEDVRLSIVVSEIPSELTCLEGIWGSVCGILDERSPGLSG